METSELDTPQIPRPQQNTAKNYFTPKDLNYEEYRLRTFSSWPDPAPVPPDRLAKAGFYYLGNGIEVICFSCEGRISDWTYGDIAMTKHSRMFPNCRFVNNVSHNVPLSKRTEEQTNGHSNSARYHLDSPECEGPNGFIYPRPLPNIAAPHILPARTNGVTVPSHSREFLNRMKYEDERLNTFLRKWPIDYISPVDLARAGFFYLGISDKVRCAFCLGVLTCWSPGDKPYLEHVKNFPSCQFVMLKDVGNVPNGGDTCGSESGRRRPMPHSGPENGRPRPYSTIEDLERIGVTMHKGPLHPSQASRDARLRSFLSWPQNAPVKKEELAEAGFFYFGINDNTKCFYCDGGLSSWEPGDSPWEEHARWFPNCNFVILNKGYNFIRESMKKSVDPSDRRFIHPIPSSVRHQNSDGIPVQGSDPGSSHTTSETNGPSSEQVLDERVEAAMQSSLVKAFTQANAYPAQLIRLAILRKLQMTGSGVHSVDELSDAVHKVKNDQPTIFKIPGNCAEDEPMDIPKGHDGNQPGSINSLPSLEEENRQLKEQRMCKICMDQEVGVVFLPCGHLIACVQCGPALKDCALCRTPIEGTIRTFLS